MVVRLVPPAPPQPGITGRWCHHPVPRSPPSGTVYPADTARPKILRLCSLMKILGCFHPSDALALDHAHPLRLLGNQTLDGCLIVPGLLSARHRVLSQIAGFVEGILLSCGRSLLAIRFKQPYNRWQKDCKRDWFGEKLRQPP